MAKCARFGRTIGQPEQFAPVPFAQAFLVSAFRHRPGSSRQHENLRHVLADIG